MVVVPLPTDVTFPRLSTLATASLLLDHVTDPCSASAGVNVTVIFILTPTSVMVVLPGDRLIDVMEVAGVGDGCAGVGEGCCVCDGRGVGEGLAGVGEGRGVGEGSVSRPVLTVIVTGSPLYTVVPAGML